ncbi:MAG: transcription regulator gal80 [Sclerophora amabilis]|nr:MAG: transcription regulator gal80 [Sclerophora amabilis]
MAPIRVAIVGLSTESNPQKTGAWAANAHLPYLKSSPHYDIVAVCNSSVESAQRTIAHHGFSSSVKGYGSPEDLAKDSNVDLVVISVNVEKHYVLAKPSLEAGKSLFVEWPLGANLQQAEELTKIARANGGKTAVGLQSRTSVAGSKIKELISSGKIGTIRSSSVLMTFSAFSGPVLPEMAAYFADKSVGGNMLTINAMHRKRPPYLRLFQTRITAHYGSSVIDHVNFILGEFSSLNATLINQVPTVDIINDEGKIIKSRISKDTPDQIMLQGILPNDVAFSLHHRTSTALDGKPVRWLISGTDGEIEITCPMPMWQMTAPGTTVRVCKADGEVEEVSLEVDDEISKLPWIGHNTARIYEAFAKGETEKHATFEDAVVRHRLIDVMWKNAAEKGISYQSSY